MTEVPGVPAPWPVNIVTAVAQVMMQKQGATFERVANRLKREYFPNSNNQEIQTYLDLCSEHGVIDKVFIRSCCCCYFI